MCFHFSMQQTIWDSRSLGNYDKIEEKDVIAELAIQLADRITQEKM